MVAGEAMPPGRKGREAGVALPFPVDLGHGSIFEADTPCFQWPSEKTIGI